MPGPLPKVFLSSTIYDLRDLRDVVQNALRKKGYTVLASEDGSIPVNSNKHSYEVCIEAARNCDSLIAIIDGRFGGLMPDGKTSITRAEVETALGNGKQVYIFVRQGVWDAKEIYGANTKAGHPFVPNKIVDDERVFHVIDAIRKRATGNWIFQFNKPSELIETVLFQLESYQANNIAASTAAPTKLGAEIEVVRIKDMSTSVAKRYSAFLILNQDCEHAILHDLVTKTTEELKHESFQNPGIMQKLWADKPAQVIWTFVARSMEDIDHSNWICRSLWVDPKVEKALSIHPLGGDEKVNGIEFIWNPDYAAQKEFVASNRASKGEVLRMVEKIARTLLEYASLANCEFAKLSKGALNEANFADILQKLGAEVRELYRCSGDIPYGPSDTLQVAEACHFLGGSVDEMFDAYSVKWMSEMTALQRRNRFERAASNFQKDSTRWEAEWERVHHG